MALLHGFFFVILCTTLAAAASWREGNANKGRQVYLRHCARCHGEALDGKGPDAATLAIPPVNFHTYLSRLKEEAELEYTIEHGRDGTAMHGWDEPLTDAQVHDLIAYIRSEASQLK